MTATISIAQLQARGFRPTPSEAVAICQTLIHNDHTLKPHPPVGPPSAENVFLGEDGAVVCRGSAATPAVFELALLLQALLPAGTAAVPSGLRYAIGRALFDVEGPPFDSLADFSQALGNYECGERAEVVRGMVRRAVERRRNQASATELRRELRERDRQLYGALMAIHEPRGRRSPMAGPVAACVLTGVALIGAGHIMSPRLASVPQPVDAAGAPAVTDVHGAQVLAPPLPDSRREPVAAAAYAAPAAPAPIDDARRASSGVTRSPRVRSSRPPTAGPDPHAEGNELDRGSIPDSASAVVRAPRAAATAAPKRSLSKGVIARIRIKWEEL